MALSVGGRSLLPLGATKTLLLLYAGAATALTVIYTIRPDGFAAVTVLPAWTWLLLVLPLIPFVRRKYVWQLLVCVSIWIVFVVLHVEEPISVLRGLFSPAMALKEDGEDIIRLVTFNCGGGQRDALKEIYGAEINEPTSAQLNGPTQWMA